MEERMIKATELAYRVGASVQTITTWYKFKEENPDNEYSHMLPDYVRLGARNTRYWRESDIGKLIEFRKSIPQGRNGVLGSVTQKYVGRKHMDVQVKRDQNQPDHDKAKPIIKKSYIAVTEELLLRNDVEPETVDHVIQILKEELAWRESLRRQY